LILEVIVEVIAHLWYVLRPSCSQQPSSANNFHSG